MASIVLAGIGSAIFGQAAIAAAFGLAVGSLAAYATAFAIGAGLSLVSRALMPSPDLGGQMAGRSITTKASAQSRKLVYGRARIGGNIVYLESTGSADHPQDNTYLWLVIAVAAHEIDAYEEVWFNDEKIWSGGNFVSTWGNFVQIGFHKGDDVAADSDLVAASATQSGKWTTSHKLLDTAYMVVRLKHDVDQFSRGLPNISTVIRGKKVLQRNGSTVAWSDNPALCVYDYLKDTKYGLGESVSNINFASVQSAVDVCNQPVDLLAGGTQTRYTINGVVDTAGSLKSNIETMISSMAGRLVFTGGKFEVHAGSYVAPTITIDESQIVGAITVQTKQSRRTQYNAVKGVFLSSAENYALSDYPAQQSKTTAGYFEVTSPPSVRYKILELGGTDFTLIGAASNTVGLDFTATGAGTGNGVASLFIAEDGEEIFLDMALPFTTDNIRAQRLARLALLRSRQQEAITIPCNLSALRFKIGDNINVYNARFGWTNPSKVFEVVGYDMAFSSGGDIVVNVQAIETSASIWAWSTSDEEVFLQAGEVAIYDGSVSVAPTAINVTSDSFLNADGTWNSQFNVAWPDADDAFTDHYVVEWKLASATDYFSQQTKSSPFNIVNLQSSQTYNVRVKAVNELGVSSTYINSTPIAGIDATEPSLPSLITATAGYKSISLAWTNPSQKDFNNVEIWRSATPTGTYLEVSNVAGGFGAKAEHLDGGLGNAQSYSYKFKSVDLTGNKTSTADFDNQTAVTQTTDAASTDGASSFTFNVYRRSAIEPTAPSGGSYDFTDNEITSPTNWYADIPAVNGNPLWASSTTARITGITGTDSNLSWGPMSKVMQDGGAGKSVYTPFVFRRKSGTAPSRPSGGTFNFGTNVLTPPTGWYTGIPTGTDPVYACNFTFSIDGDTGTVTAGQWSIPAISNENGEDAVSTFTYPVYKRDTTTPSKPTNGSYNFTLNTITAPTAPATWYEYIPTGTNPVYVSVAKAQITGATGTDTNIVYLNPTLAFQDGGIGETGARNASGYLYYSVSQATAPTKPTATGYNFATGAFTFTGSTGTNWSRTIPEATGGDQQFWATSYLVSESAYGTIGSIVFSAPFSSIYFNGLVTFQNLNNALGTAGGDITTIDGGLIETNSIIATKILVDNLAAISANMGTITAGSISSALITGDVTEVYPIGQYYYTDLTSSQATLGSFTIPAPTSGILKRQKIDINVLFKIENANQTPYAQSSIVFTVQKKSKGVNAVTVGTVTVESESIAYNQLLSISGNVLDKIDVSGGVAASANASGTNEPAYIQAVFYDSGANKTYVQCSAYTDLFSNGNTMYFSDSKFTSAGTWVTPTTSENIFIPTPPDPSSGLGYASVYLPFKMSYGQTTTLTDYRARANSSSGQSGVTYTAMRMIGTLENIS